MANGSTGLTLRELPPIVRAESVKLTDESFETAREQITHRSIELEDYDAQFYPEAPKALQGIRTFEGIMQHPNATDQRKKSLVSDEINTTTLTDRAPMPQSRLTKCWSKKLTLAIVSVVVGVLCIGIVLAVLIGSSD